MYDEKINNHDVYDHYNQSIIENTINNYEQFLEIYTETQEGLM